MELDSGLICNQKIKCHVRIIINQTKKKERNDWGYIVVEHIHKEEEKCERKVAGGRMRSGDKEAPDSDDGRSVERCVIMIITGSSSSRGAVRIWSRSTRRKGGA